MATNSLSVRALNPISWDPLNGNGQNNFIYDLEAAAQILAQRMRFFQGEWWENTSAGFPMFQSILGSSGSPKNLQVIIGIVSAYISATASWVTGVSSITVSFQNRKLALNATVETIFGTAYLTNQPVSTAALQGN